MSCGIVSIFKVPLPASYSLNERAGGITSRPGLKQANLPLEVARLTGFSFSIQALCPKYKPTKYSTCTLRLPRVSCRGGYLIPLTPFSCRRRGRKKLLGDTPFDKAHDRPMPPPKGLRPLWNPHFENSSFSPLSPTLWGIRKLERHPDGPAKEASPWG